MDAPPPLQRSPRYQTLTNNFSVSNNISCARGTYTSLFTDTLSATEVCATIRCARNAGHCIDLIFVVFLARRANIFFFNCSSLTHVSHTWARACTRIHTPTQSDTTLPSAAAAINAFRYAFSRDKKEAWAHWATDSRRGSRFLTLIRTCCEMRTKTKIMEARRPRDKPPFRLGGLYSRLNARSANN